MIWSFILLNVLFEASSITMHHILYRWSYVLEYLTWINVLYCYFPPLLFCLSMSILLCVSFCRNTFQSLFSVFNFVLLFPHRPQPIPSASFFFLFSLILLTSITAFHLPRLPPISFPLEYRCCNLPCLMLSIALNNNEIAPAPSHHWWRHCLS